MNYFDRIAFDPSTGIFTWCVAGPGIAIGREAGTVTCHGYRVVRLGRQGYRAHRLAWFLTHGTWPAGEIDHINGDKLDNRIDNLRVVTRSENAQNVSDAMRNNCSCGLLGVTWNKQHRRWQSKIQANRVMHHVGYFDDPHVAHAAYMAKKALLHIGGRSH